jgi:hypothetical protein
MTTEQALAWQMGYNIGAQVRKEGAQFALSIWYNFDLDAPFCDYSWYDRNWKRLDY